jgi:hypothetical protein
VEGFTIGSSFCFDLLFATVTDIITAMAAISITLVIIAARFARVSFSFSKKVGF